MTSHQENQFVLFLLKDQMYGVNIKNVQTIERFKTIMRVPKTPKSVKGVMNLRGEIIPIITISPLLEIEERANSLTTRIMILRLQETLVGVIVDEVKEVVALEVEKIHSVQNIRGLSNQYIDGIGQVDEGKEVITLLNLDTIVEDAFGMVKDEEHRS
ncbi:MAG: chemotaxis protein CheW [Cellulosilyticaceae bacterium]